MFAADALIYTSRKDINNVIDKLNKELILIRKDGRQSAETEIEAVEQTKYLGSTL